MTKKHDELVEKIAQKVREHRHRNSIYDRVLARHVITCALSAVRDGLELSEEEWRGRLEFGRTRQVDSLVVTRGHLAIKEGDTWEVIAHRLDRLGLRKEGKEEEG